MKSLTTLVVLALCAAPATAQMGVPALDEQFNTSSVGFPPPGWAVNTLPAHTAAYLWSDSAGQFNSAIGASFPATDAAGHGYDGPGFISDDRLEGPDMDLSTFGAPELMYDGMLGWAAYMAHTGGVIGSSWIEVSTDAGATFTAIWQEASTVDYYTTGIIEDLSAYANQPQVRLAFHYEGDWAHEWGIDNVLVDNVGPTGPGLALTGTCPGPVTANASNMTPGGPVVMAYGFAGSYTVPGGPCAGLMLNMATPTILATVIADASGNASLGGNAPAAACGNVFLVAVDGATCTGSNILGL